MEAAASVIGVVSFGLGLAKSLQAFIDSVIEAEETMTLILAEVNATASTLKRLQDFIEQDKAASEKEHRATVFNDTGVKEIDACALQCQKIYVQIIILIEKASMQAGEDEAQDTGPRAPVPDDLSTPVVRLAAFNKNVTKLGRKMRWPWLEPRIKRCQEHLARFKFNLMISLQVFLIAESRTRPPVARIFGTDDENEIRDRAETLRKKVTEMQVKKSPPEKSNRQPPGSDNGAVEESDASSTTTNAFTTSGDSSSSSGIINDRPSSSSSSSIIHESTPSSSSSLRSERGHVSRGTRMSRKSRATRTLRAFKVHVWKRIKRESVFKKDSKSAILEAYLIYPVSGPIYGSPTLIKLPFGHRRLTREVKRALRKCNPWDILVILSPQHRIQVDKVVEQVQLAATGTTNVCLVAIDVDGYRDADISDLKSGDLAWTRMALFFRHDPVQAREGTTEAGKDVIGGRHRLTATVRNIFMSNQMKNKARLGLRETLRREHEEKTSAAEQAARLELEKKVSDEIAKRDAETRARQEQERISQEKQLEHDRRIADEARGQLLDTQMQEEDEKRRQQKEREELEEKIRNDLKVEEMKARQEREDQARKDAEAALEAIEKGIGEGELKKMSEAERAKKILEDERAKMRSKEEKAAVEKAAAEKPKPSLRFRDAVGRKFNFPFHLVQTWMGMEKLIKEAFVHVQAIGPHVQEGHYDLMGSEGQIILPSLWSATVKPGDTISMRMWPENKHPLTGLGQHLSPEQMRMRMDMLRRQQAAMQGGYGGHHGGRHSGHAQPMRPPGLGYTGGVPFGGQPPPPPVIRERAPPGFHGGVPFGGQPPPPPAMRSFPLPAGCGRGSLAMMESVDGGRPKNDRGRKAKKTSGFFSGTRPSRRGKSKTVKTRHDEGSDKSDKGETLEDIDKELGLDDLEEAEQTAAKDIDELLETWTNVGRGK